MTQSCFSWNHDTLTAFSVYSLDTVPARVLWAPQTAVSHYKKLLTFRFSLVVLVTGFFKGCSKKLLDILTSSQTCKATLSSSEFNSSAVNNGGKLLGLNAVMKILANPPYNISTSQFPVSEDFWQGGLALSFHGGHRGHHGFEPSASTSSHMGY